MNITSDPGALFREVREMDSLLLALVAAPEQVKWHWPTFYLLYVELDRMSWRLQRAEHLFKDPVTLGEIDEQDAVEGANACLDAVGSGVKATAGFLWNVARGISSSIGDAHLRLRLQAHFHPKSSWYQAFRTAYHAGRIAADGRSMERTILVLEPDTLERIGSPQEQFLTWHQVYDLADENVFRGLQAAARETAEIHTRVLRAYGQHFVAHCRIEDLLHPSSV